MTTWHWDFFWGGGLSGALCFFLPDKAQLTHSAKDDFQPTCASLSLGYRLDLLSASWPRPSDLVLTSFWDTASLWPSWILIVSLPNPQNSACLSLLVAIYGWSHPRCCGSCHNWLPSSPGFLWLCALWGMAWTPTLPLHLPSGLGTRHLSLLGSSPQHLTASGWGGMFFLGIRKVNVELMSFGTLQIIFNSG